MARKKSMSKKMKSVRTSRKSLLKRAVDKRGKTFKKRVKQAGTQFEKRIKETGLSKPLFDDTMLNKPVKTGTGLLGGIMHRRNV